MFTKERMTRMLEIRQIMKEGQHDQPISITIEPQNLPPVEGEIKLSIEERIRKMMQEDIEMWPAMTMSNKELGA